MAHKARKLKRQEHADKVRVYAWWVRVLDALKILETAQSFFHRAMSVCNQHDEIQTRSMSTIANPCLTAILDVDRSSIKQRKRPWQSDTFSATMTVRNDGLTSFLYQNPGPHPLRAARKRCIHATLHFSPANCQTATDIRVPDSHPKNQCHQKNHKGILHESLSIFFPAKPL